MTSINVKNNLYTQKYTHFTSIYIKSVHLSKKFHLVKLQPSNKNQIQYKDEECYCPLHIYFKF